MSEYPDAKNHKRISILKSLIRIVGFIVLPIDLIAGVVVLISAEILGIVEELV